MIQRIQSVFLFFAAALLSGQFALPYYTASQGANSGDVSFNMPASLADGQLNPTDNPGLLGLTILGIITSFIAIFLFKNRPLQGRIAGVSGAVTIMLTVLAGIVFYQTEQQVPTSAGGAFGFGLALPVIALVLQVMAQRAIKKDEQKVRSMDRLR
jgi:hypothetical protein